MFKLVSIPCQWEAPLSVRSSHWNGICMYKFVSISVGEDGWYVYNGYKLCHELSRDVWNSYLQKSYDRGPLSPRIMPSFGTIIHIVQFLSASSPIVCCCVLVYYRDCNRWWIIMGKAKPRKGKAARAITKRLSWANDEYVFELIGRYQFFKAQGEFDCPKNTHSTWGSSKHLSKSCPKFKSLLAFCPKW